MTLVNDCPCDTGLDTLRAGAYPPEMPRKTSTVATSAGRPRSQRARRAVLDAARELVEEGGYASATIEAIAARSGVAKTTVYRSWPNRASLLVDLLVEITDEVAPPPKKAGDPLRAMRTELRHGAIAANGLVGRLLTSLLGEAQQDPEVRTALLDRLFYPRRESSVGAIVRAQKIAAIRPDVPPFVAVDLLFGPLFYRMFVRHEPVTESFVKQVVQFVLEGIEPRRPRRK
jgi:AcrR family transcriptional regulator